MTETLGGKTVVEQAIGRVLKPGEVLDSFAGKLQEPGMKGVADRLEARVAEIESEFKRKFPAAGAELTIEQRASLKVLSHQELEGFDFVGADAQPGGFESNRQIFVEAVGSEGLHQKIRFPFGVSPAEHPDWMIQFGFESEFTMAELEGLLGIYGPAPEFGVSGEAWLKMPKAERVTWVKANLGRLFPNVREFGGLVKVERDPLYQFMPERLLRDSTGNLEIVLQPVDTYEEWKRRIFLINEKVGVGSMQGTLSVPSDAFFGRPSAAAPATMTEADLGFFNFHNDLDTFEKLEVGAARYARDPSKAAANSFNHPFLGPMTQLKQELMVEYLHANARGEWLDAATLKRVSADDNSFKYFGGTAYRPDIAPGRVVLEVRDAHTNVEALLEHMSRALVYLQDGRSAFTQAAGLRAFDSKVDFVKLPENVQALLKQLYPSKMQAGLDYNEKEQLALEVYRNFAYPMRDWDSQLHFLGRADLSNTVKLAQRGYSAKLAQVAADLQAGKITAQQASLRVQGAVVEFAGESKLGAAYRARARQLLDQTVHQPGHGFQFMSA